MGLESDQSGREEVLFCVLKIENIRIAKSLYKGKWIGTR